LGSSSGGVFFCWESMNSKLMWGVVLTLACASAVRRSGKSEDFGLEHIQSLLEKHTGAKKAKKSAEMLRSLQVMTSTPGVSGNISKAVERLQQNVVDKILIDSRATQTKITDSVSSLNTSATEARAKHTAAEIYDQAWNECIVQEEGVMVEIVRLQGMYNKKTVATVAPCQKEIDTEAFTHTSEALTIACNLVEDQDCTTAFAAFQSKVADIERTMEAQVNASVKLHTDAEDNCDAANDSQILAKASVATEQGVWEHNHSICLGKNITRNGAMCTFGQKLQTSCEKKSTYDNLIAEVNGTGNPMSIADRKEELEVGELVICLLHNFVKGLDLTDAVIDGCSQNATSSLHQLDLDLKGTEVDAIVMGQDIKCVEGNQIAFTGSVWDAPMPSDGTLPRPSQFDQILPLPIPTYENSSLPEYVNRPWKATYSSTGDPFTVCAS